MPVTPNSSTGKTGILGWVTALLAAGALTVGALTFTGTAKFNDNVAATFGTDNDSSILHNGTDLLLTTTTGDVIVTPAGGQLIVKQPGGVAGTDEVQIYDDGTFSYVEGKNTRLRILGTRIDLTSGSGGLNIQGTNTWPNAAGTHDLGLTSLEFRGFYLGEDASSGAYWGLDQDVRAWFDEASTDNFFLTSSKGDFVFEPGGGEVVIRQSGGVAGTDQLEFSHNGSSALIESKDGQLNFRAAGTTTVWNGTSFSATTANVRDLGTASVEWRGLYLGEDASSGAYFGLDQDVRLYYDETTDDILKLAGNGNGFELETDLTITGAVTDGYVSALRLDPGYTAATAQTVTRHNYIDIQDVSVAGAGPAAVTNACVFRFDAAAGTHKATAAGGATTSIGTTSGWILVNFNGTLAYVPAFSTTNP